MKPYKRIVWLVIVFGLFGWSTLSFAQSLAELVGQPYIVQADDRLERLAEKFYNDPLTLPSIIQATNLKAAQDDAYAPINNPDAVAVGQRLFIPDTLDAFELVQADISSTETDPTPEQLALLASLDVKGTPPELFNEVWLNSDPLKLADLQGQVVIVEFWTYG